MSDVSNANSGFGGPLSKEPSMHVPTKRYENRAPRSAFSVIISWLLFLAVVGGLIWGIVYLANGGLTVLFLQRAGIVCLNLYLLVVVLGASKEAPIIWVYPIGSAVLVMLAGLIHKIFGGSWEPIPTVWTALGDAFNWVVNVYGSWCWSFFT